VLVDGSLVKLQEWAHIAEIAGGIAVLGTLVFLVIEVQDNTRAIDSATFQEISRDVQSIILEVPTEIRDKVRIGQEITGPERREYIGFVVMALRIIESWWQQWQVGTLSDEVFQSYITHLSVTLGDEFSRDVWTGSRDVSFLPGFEEYVESFIADNPLGD
jgi:hypothetical protein